MKPDQSNHPAHNPGCVSPAIQRIFACQEPAALLRTLWQCIAAIVAGQPLTAKQDKKAMRSLFAHCRTMLHEAHAQLYATRHHPPPPARGKALKAIPPPAGTAAHPFSDPGKRSLMFAGKVSHLDYAHCLNPAALLHRFFTFATLRQWEATLQYWHKAALGKRGKGKRRYQRRLPASYQYLCRFIEACYILQEAEVNGLPTQPLAHYFVRDVLPLHCPPEALLEPLSTISSLLGADGGLGFKAQLGHWAARAQLPGAAPAGDKPAQWLHLYFSTHILVELAFMLGHAHYFYPYQHYATAAQPPAVHAAATVPASHLSYSEQALPFGVLAQEVGAALCGHREVLDDWLTAALSPGHTVDGTAAHLLSFYRIIEALQLIACRFNPIGQATAPA